MLLSAIFIVVTITADSGFFITPGNTIFMEVFYENRFKRIRKRIKLTRKGQDLTQEMLAEKAGVSQHYIYEIEAGRKAMSIHSFASSYYCIDVSADYLLFGDGQRIFDVDTPAHHNNQLMEIAAELNPSQRDHVLEILEVMVPYIKN